VGGLEGCGEMLGGLGEKPEGGGVVRGGLVGGEKRKGKEPFGRIRLDEVEEEGMEEEDESVDYGVGEVMEIDGWEET